MTNIAFLGTDGGVNFSAEGFDAALSRVGMNTGNTMFQHALWRRVRDPKMIVAPHHDAAWVRERADVLLIPAANQINPAWNLEAWADFVERVDLPVAIIGLGAQAPIDASPALELQPGTRRFLHLVRERASRIGVRGPFTQEVLAHHGVENAVVTGCPSQTINLRARGTVIAQRLADAAQMGESARIAYVFGTMEAETRAVEARLSTLIARHPHRVVFQTEPRLMRLLHERRADEASAEFVAWLRGVLRPSLSAEAYSDYLLENGRFFSDARSWIDAMRRFDLALGMRIHGVVAAIQSERAGICVAFDSRTLELSRTMGYPYVRAEDIAATDTVADIVRKAVFDAPRFDHLKVVHARRVDAILSEAGVALVT